MFGQVIYLCRVNRTMFLFSKPYIILPDSRALQLVVTPQVVCDEYSKGLDTLQLRRETTVWYACNKKIMSE